MASRHSPPLDVNRTKPQPNVDRQAEIHSSRSDALGPIYSVFALQAVSAAISTYPRQYSVRQGASSNVKRYAPLHEAFAWMYLLVSVESDYALKFILVKKESVSLHVDISVRRNKLSGKMRLFESSSVVTSLL